VVHTLAESLTVRPTMGWQWDAKPPPAVYETSATGSTPFVSFAGGFAGEPSIADIAFSVSPNAPITGLEYQ